MRSPLIGSGFGRHGTLSIVQGKLALLEHLFRRGQGCSSLRKFLLSLVGGNVLPFTVELLEFGNRRIYLSNVALSVDNPLADCI